MRRVIYYTTGILVALIVIAVFWFKFFAPPDNPLPVANKAAPATVVPGVAQPPSDETKLGESIRKGLKSTADELRDSEN